MTKRTRVRRAGAAALPGRSLLVYALLSAAALVAGAADPEKPRLEEQVRQLQAELAGSHAAVEEERHVWEAEALKPENAPALPLAIRQILQLEPSERSPADRATLEAYYQDRSPLRRAIVARLEAAQRALAAATASTRPSPGPASEPRSPAASPPGGSHRATPPAGSPPGSSGTPPAAPSGGLKPSPPK
jgi:hypothetical protein